MHVSDVQHGIILEPAAGRTQWLDRRPKGGWVPCAIRTFEPEGTRCEPFPHERSDSNGINTATTAVEAPSVIARILHTNQIAHQPFYPVGMCTCYNSYAVQQYSSQELRVARGAGVAIIRWERPSAYSGRSHRRIGQLPSLHTYQLSVTISQLSHISCALDSCDFDTMDVTGR